MPVRTVFRDPTSGRFISRQAAEELGEAIQLTISDGNVTSAPVSFFDEEEDDGGVSYDPYDIEPSRWGARMIVNAGEDDLDRLHAQDFPDGYDGFRVSYKISGNPRYPRDYISTEWLGPSEWPPSLDLLEGVEPDEIGHIVFRRSQ